MIGLIMLLVVGIYLALWALVTIFSYRISFKATKSKKKSYAIASIFFLVMYLIPFWDLIPTLVMHKYYCSTQAGFWVYKTPEEWSQENPGVINKLHPYKTRIPLNLPVGNVYQINDRFGSISSIEKISYFPIRKSLLIILDIETKEKIYEKINFVRGYGQLSVGKKGYLKFWLYDNSCFSYEEERNFGKTSESLAKKFHIE